MVKIKSNHGESIIDIPTNYICEEKSSCCLSFERFFWNEQSSVRYISCGLQKALVATIVSPQMIHLRYWISLCKPLTQKLPQVYLPTNWGWKLVGSSCYDKEYKPIIGACECCSFADSWLIKITHKILDRFRNHTGKENTDLLLRIKLISPDANMPFWIPRFHLSAILPFAMTINKAQILKKLKIYLPIPIFTQGHIMHVYSKASK